jgi:hypothetical protein
MVLTMACEICFVNARSCGRGTELSARITRKKTAGSPSQSAPQRRRDAQNLRRQGDLCDGAKELDLMSERPGDLHLLIIARRKGERQNSTHDCGQAS